MQLFNKEMNLRGKLMTEGTDSSIARYYILRRELYRIRDGEAIPMSWDNGSWEKKPFAFEVETRGHMISEEEAKHWIHLRGRRTRVKVRL